MPESVSETWRALASIVAVVGASLCFFLLIVPEILATPYSPAATPSNPRVLVPCLLLASFVGLFLSAHRLWTAALLAGITASPSAYFGLYDIYGPGMSFTRPSHLLLFLGMAALSVGVSRLVRFVRRAARRPVASPDAHAAASQTHL